MGAVKTKVAKNMHSAIKKDDIERAKRILEQYPDAANYPIHSGMTTPMCRVAYLNKKQMAMLFLKAGADINVPCKKNGNTPLMWAAWRNNIDMVEWLIDQGADIHIKNFEGENALDVAVQRLSYEAALVLKKKGLQPKEEEFYQDKVATEFDIDVFVQYLKEEIEVTDKSVFFQKVKLKEQEEANKDMVIDPRETWKDWFKRTAKFEDPPMVARDELPEKLQRQNSLFNKTENYLNGINPYPPGHKWNKNPVKDSQISDSQPSISVREEKDEYLDNNEEEKYLDKENSKPSFDSVKSIGKKDEMTMQEA